MKILLLLSFSLHAYAQQPLIQSVLNAATNEPGYLAPQTLVSIYGQDLAPVIEQALGFPLPTEMKGASGTAVKVIVTQVPSESRPLPFSAPGLTLGGAQVWRYVTEFPDLLSEPR